jgi:hypothetical protein
MTREWRKARCARDSRVSPTNKSFLPFWRRWVLHSGFWAMWAHTDLLRLGLVVRRASGLVDSAIVEAAIIAGRQLIQFLGFGIKYNREGRPILAECTKYHDYGKDGDRYTDEVKIVDLGGSFLKLTSLTDQKKSILAEFCHGASKSTAHLTEGSEHKLPYVFCPGCDLILKLVSIALSNHQSAAGAPIGEIRP